MAFVNLMELERAARGILPKVVLDYYYGGSDHEVTPNLVR
ncbi:hypothetical protein D8I24_4389 [Cupriavidus necator H850]|nr:hypothetical protein D8I24_4389 [Cupriavidus necator H850]